GDRGGWVGLLGRVAVVQGKEQVRAYRRAGDAHAEADLRDEGVAFGGSEVAPVLRITHLLRITLARQVARLDERQDAEDGTREEPGATDTVCDVHPGPVVRRRTSGRATDVDWLDLHRRSFFGAQEEVVLGTGVECFGDDLVGRAGSRQDDEMTPRIDEQLERRRGRRLATTVVARPGHEHEMGIVRRGSLLER